jgi:hypothetical protein
MVGAVRLGTAATAIFLAAASCALADGGGPRASLALGIIHDVGRKVEQDPGCRFRPSAQGPVDGAPSNAFVQTLGVLGRPATPADPSEFPPEWRFVPAYYRGYGRLLHAADGTPFEIFAVKDVKFARARPGRCVAELRRRVRHAVAHRSRAFRRVVKAQLHREIAFVWAPHPTEGIYVFADGQLTVGPLAGLQHRGISWLTASMTVPDARFYEVVPDGVATVDFTFRRLEPTGYWSKHHPITNRTAATVHDNVVSLHLPLTLRDLALDDQVWRDSEGKVIRVISGD